MSLTDLNDKPMRMLRLVLYYSVLFSLLAAGVFSVFILSGKSFLQYGDGFKQGFFWTADLKHILAQIQDGGGLPQWSWSKGLGMQYHYTADPFNLLAALFPLKYLELGITIALILRLYLGGLTYLLFARDQGMSNYQCILGPVIYIFSSWFINVTMIQGQFIFLAYMLPLLFMSIDRVYRRKSPLLFIAVVAYFLIRDAYLAYIAAIGAILFIFIRYFAYCDRFRLRDYLTAIGRFVGYGLIASLISAFSLSQFVLATLQASMESSGGEGHRVFCSIYYVLGFAKTLMSAGLTTGYAYLGLPILALMILPLLFKKISLKNSPVIMSLILMVMMFFPFFNRMFNGFGYSTCRWYFLIVFFLSWATVQNLDIRELQKPANLRIMGLWLVLLAIWTLGLDALGLLDYSLRTKAFIALNLLTGAALLFSIGAFRESRITVKHRQIATIALTGLMLVTGWSLSFYLNQSKFISIGEVSGLLHDSTQRVSASIGDDGFYRVDQVDWINCHQSMKMPVNENLWWQSKSIYNYNSFIPASLLDFSGKTGDNYGHMMRVYQLSNDNRMGLDFLYGVKYFLGDNDRIRQETGYHSDDYRGYGFTYYKTIDGVNVFRNKYDPGLGFAYDACIPESEFLKLGRLEREQALLQACVVSDAEAGRLRQRMNTLSTSDIETDVKSMDYEVIRTDGLRIKEGKIIAEKEDASFTVRVKDVRDCQLVVSFDGLARSGGKPFSLSCDDGRIHEEAHKRNANQALSNVRDFDLNMGYYDHFDGALTIALNHRGRYVFDDFRISAMAVSNYDTYASQRLAEKYEITEYDAHQVIGTVEAKEDGILFFSIPQHDNWDVYIDSVKSEKLSRANLAFLGAPVSKGVHKVELRYHNRSLRCSLLLSLLGLLLTIPLIYNKILLLKSKTER